MSIAVLTFGNYDIVLLDYSADWSILMASEHMPTDTMTMPGIPHPEPPHCSVMGGKENNLGGALTSGSEISDALGPAVVAQRWK